MEIIISKLNLISPLFYIPVDGEDPFNCRLGVEDAPEAEKIFCFELDEEEQGKIEPDKTKLLGKLVLSGRAAGEVGEMFWKIPAGEYLFSQKREILNQEEITSMAFEIQQEGLWQRLKPGKLLYLRYLFEDGGFVTQLLRPFS